MKYLEKSEDIYNKETKNGNPFYISRKIEKLLLLQFIKHLK